MKNVTFVPGSYKVRVQVMGKTVYVGAYSDQREAERAAGIAAELSAELEEKFHETLSARLNGSKPAAAPAPAAPAPAPAAPAPAARVRKCDIEELTFGIISRLPECTYDSEKNQLIRGDKAVDAAGYTSIYNEMASVQWIAWQDKGTKKFVCKTPNE